MCLKICLLKDSKGYLNMVKVRSISGRCCRRHTTSNMFWKYFYKTQTMDVSCRYGTRNEIKFYPKFCVQKIYKIKLKCRENIHIEWVNILLTFLCYGWLHTNKINIFSRSQLLRWMVNVKASVHLISNNN